MNDVWQALSHPARRRILAELRDGPKAAGEIAELFTFSAPTLSGHLNRLRVAELVHVERRGNHRIYHLNLSVAEDALSGLLDMLRICAPAATTEDPA